MANESFNIAPLLEKLTANPAAMSAVRGLLGGLGDPGGGQDPAPDDAAAEDAKEVGAIPGDGAIPALAGLFSDRKRGKGRCEFLRTLRPYLGTRRAASVDRMIRALELYDLIEETHLLGGGN